VSTAPVAVVGVGQTHHKSRRLDVSFGGLVREAVFRALDDAHMTMATSTPWCSARRPTSSRA